MCTSDSVRPLPVKPMEHGPNKQVHVQKEKENNSATMPTPSGTSLFARSLEQAPIEMHKKVSVAR
jgi:hypothetical protein